MNNKISTGFTLIEIIVVLAVISIMATFLTTQVSSNFAKSRDSRRKMDIQQIQRAIELYYTDNRRYPDAATMNTLLTSGGQFCHPGDCNTASYMDRIPVDPVSTCRYIYETPASRTYFAIYSAIENTQDQSSGVNQAGIAPYSGATSCGCGPCKFRVVSSNYP